jgi:hypothetical protein
MLRSERSERLEAPGRNHPSSRSLRSLLSSTLADLGGVGESIFHALPDMMRNFDTISARP